eukprot:TRINITY_DN6685_c0_g1_i2.p1 TRINITY_DN6685_c0_g1~~TRINITY_DN6685_c0_g1_i2.p1  ORF type:complete len:321 (+),score=2.87 TRINITY_DN6685_c0_g1_i2:148-1110(+)
MPQLDFLSFPSQAFYLIFFLALLVILLFRFILPDLLLIVKTTNTLFSFDPKTFKQTESSTVFNPSFPSNDSFYKLFTSFFSLPNHNPKLFNKFFFQESQSFFHSLTHKSFLTPFLLFVTPSDTFLLTLSFATFFFLIYTFVSVRFLNPFLNDELAKRESQLLLLNDLKTDSLLKQHDILQKEATFLLTSKSLIAFSFDYARSHQDTFSLPTEFNFQNETSFSSTSFNEPFLLKAVLNNDVSSDFFLILLFLYDYENLFLLFNDLKSFSSTLNNESYLLSHVLLFLTSLLFFFTLDTFHNDEDIDFIDCSFFNDNDSENLL